MRRLRGELLETALGYYREFLRKRGGDPALRRELADAQFRVGQIMPRDRHGRRRPSRRSAPPISIWERPARRRAGRPGRAGPARPGASWRSASSSPGSGTSPRPSRPEAVARASSRVSPRRRTATRPTGSPWPNATRELGIAEGEVGALDRGTRAPGGGRGDHEGAVVGHRPAIAAYRKRLADTINAQGFIHCEERPGRRGAPRLPRVPGDLPVPARGTTDRARSPRSCSTRWGRAITTWGRSCTRRIAGRCMEGIREVARVPGRRWWRPTLGDTTSARSSAMSLAEIARCARVRPGPGGVRRGAEGHRDARRSWSLAQPDQPRYRAELGRALNILGFLSTKSSRQSPGPAGAGAGPREQEQRGRRHLRRPTRTGHRSSTSCRTWASNTWTSGGWIGACPYRRTRGGISRKLLAAHPGERDRTLGLVRTARDAGRRRAPRRRSEAAERSYADGRRRPRAAAARGGQRRGAGPTGRAPDGRGPRRGRPRADRERPCGAAAPRRGRPGTRRLVREGGPGSRGSG